MSEWGRCYQCGTSARKTTLRERRGCCYACIPDAAWDASEEVIPADLLRKLPKRITAHAGYIIDDRHVTLDQAVKMWDGEDAVERMNALLESNSASGGSVEDGAVVIEEEAA